MPLELSTRMSDQRAKVPRTPECGVCLESFPQLPCSHSFCLHCLGQAVLRSTTTSSAASPSSSSSSPSPSSYTSFPCPTCRTPTDLPSAGLHSLESGFAWGTYLDTSSTTTTTSNNNNTNNSNNNNNNNNNSKNINAPVPRARSQRSTPRETMSDQTTPPERACSLHPGQLLRFYCARCRCPVCRDCKLAAHEGHRTHDLSPKAAEVKSVVSQVMQVAQSGLEPQLMRTLREVTDHKKGVEEAKRSILDALTRRAEELKEVVDRELAEATQELNLEAAEVDRRVSASLDDMTHGLMSFISLRDHVQNTLRDGYDSDVVELLQRLKTFFKEAVQEGTESFEVLGSDPALPSRNTTCSLSPDGVLRPFLSDDWKRSVQLSASSSSRQCGSCSRQYPHGAPACPHCSGGDNPSSRRPKKCPWFKAKSSDAPSQRQCPGCRRRNDMTFNFCPHCGMPSGQGALAAVKTFVPQHLGRVRQGRVCGGQEGSRSRLPDAVADVQSTAERGPKEIFNTIAFIVYLLESEK